jgi:hypothetical protein
MVRQHQTRNLDVIEASKTISGFRVPACGRPRNDVSLLPLLLSEDVNIGTARSDAFGFHRRIARRIALCSIAFPRPPGSFLFDAFSHALPEF